MSSKLDMNPDAFRVMANLINEELDLYDEEDLHLVMQGSLKLFTRSLLLGSLKFLDK